MRPLLCLTLVLVACAAASAAGPRDLLASLLESESRAGAGAGAFPLNQCLQDPNGAEFTPAQVHAALQAKAAALWNGLAPADEDLHNAIPAHHLVQNLHVNAVTPAFSAPTLVNRQGKASAARQQARGLVGGNPWNGHLTDTPHFTARTLTDLARIAKATDGGNNGRACEPCLISIGHHVVFQSAACYIYYHGRHHAAGVPGGNVMDDLAAGVNYPSMVAASAFHAGLPGGVATFSEALVRIMDPQAGGHARLDPLKGGAMFIAALFVAEVRRDHLVYITNALELQLIDANAAGYTLDGMIRGRCPRDAPFWGGLPGGTRCNHGTVGFGGQHPTAWVKALQHVTSSVAGGAAGGAVYMTELDVVGDWLAHFHHYNVVACPHPLPHPAPNDAAMQVLLGQMGKVVVGPLPDTYEGTASAAVRVSLTYSATAGLTVTPAGQAGVTFNPAAVAFAAGASHGDTSVVVAANTAAGNSPVTFALGGADAALYVAPAAGAFNVLARKTLTAPAYGSVAQGGTTAALNFVISHAPSAAVTLTPTGNGLVFNPAVLNFAHGGATTLTATVQAQNVPVAGPVAISYAWGGASAAEFAPAAGGSITVTAAAQLVNND